VVGGRHRLSRMVEPGSYRVGSAAGRSRCWVLLPPRRSEDKPCVLASTMKPKTENASRDALAPVGPAARAGFKKNRLSRKRESSDASVATARTRPPFRHSDTERPAS
jgi:hypothetical protein